MNVCFWGLVIGGFVDVKVTDRHKGKLALLCTLCERAQLVAAPLYRSRAEALILRNSFGIVQPVLGSCDLQAIFVLTA
jgi:hypothetical protein